VKPVCVYTIGGSSLDEVVDFFAPLHAQVPDLFVTAYLPPGPVGPVGGRPAWMEVCPLGWEGYPGECLGWTRAQAEEVVHEAEKMGYAKVLMAPWDLFDEDVLKGLIRAGASLHRGLSRQKKGFTARLFASFDPLYLGIESPRNNHLFTPETLLRFNHFARASTVLAEDPKDVLAAMRAAIKEEKQ